ncbi:MULTISPECIES: adenylyl-sulfate reductase subunit alpha [Carboxydocella]|uniref:Dissimilatory adenylylsulfate reductase alpha subunit n=2 Tax=Carboxydocella TaxID=178898 RepID=A0A1T4RZK0_9FIRM|nr:MULTISPECIES: adenylyl-sulfate reductase subunit alpha [Carboxydocella]AVX20237.1 dissimilatory adenylylsulfate reductase alpha subunit precursor [Carboxydocella thermautotrophica]AVX30654.1 dissimilatory adenylylsulfate reductase alpha subunit precursor [Carboxydocella thermautotrophica]SKA21375.1 dissimilatory adenylylsulfate reductase alpha subunit precursor [Carboxydocella sporoproducens DSM 16521]GAW28352.1 adenylyl-sulfate reductase [Carboxydocella sp. ULO1]GAW31070.1 adenylyl-sulfate
MEKVDLLIIGGGAAGCMAAIAAREIDPALRVVIMEKAEISRSGCLAAGINAINAYLNPGQTPETFLAYVKKDNYGLVRDDLVLTMAERFNSMARRLAEWGLPFKRDAEGNFLPRGPRSVQIEGESIKPVLAAAVRRAGIEVWNRTVLLDLVQVEGRVVGALGWETRTGRFRPVLARAVILATGGAAGIYRPNNQGEARHKMWYCPFNTGGGLAAGLRVGAALTSLEMRFIALRTKDAIAPTGTLAQGVKAKEVNARGENYLEHYADRTTPGRLAALLAEMTAGRGPCYLDTSHLGEEQQRQLQEAYLNMAPGAVLYWADRNLRPNQPVEIIGTEPYLVGGHGMAGFWIDSGRRTTVPGLYAAGDIAGGAPKKYVTGSMAEGEIAAHTAVAELQEYDVEKAMAAAETLLKQRQSQFERWQKQQGYLTPWRLEERLQKIMDEYAGGISTGYKYTEAGLKRARQELAWLGEDLQQIACTDNYQLLQAIEVEERWLLARALVEHMLYRKESRWPAYQEFLDYPRRDDGRWLCFINSRYRREQDMFAIEEVPYHATSD